MSGTPLFVRCALTITLSMAFAACTPPASTSASSEPAAPAQPEFQNTIESYLADYPVHNTFQSLHARTRGNTNAWFLHVPELTKAGYEPVVRMNRDTVYAGAYSDNRNGPVTVSIRNPEKDRFVSIQVNDERDFNVAAIMDADGDYVLVQDGQEAPEGTIPVKIESDFHLVIIRIEVRTPEDLPAAQAIFETVTISGPAPITLPEVDLLSRYSPEVRERADDMIQVWGRNSSLLYWFGRPDERGIRVSDLDRATGLHFAEGGPVAEHSTYTLIFEDDDGDELRGENGTYILTTEPPPVYAFWSITVYDTESGGFFHPNPLNRHHINDTMAQFNEDGTVTFTFQQVCEPSDLNCIPVPAGTFDLAFRYYRPQQPLIDGEWLPPYPVLMP